MSNTTLISLRMPNDLLAEVDRLALADRRSRAFVIVERVRGGDSSLGRAPTIPSKEEAGSNPAPRSKKVKVPDVDLTLNDGIPADADVPPRVWPTYGGITRSGDPTTPTIEGYYPPSDAGNLTVEMLASAAKVRGPRTPAKSKGCPECGSMGGHQKWCPKKGGK